MSDTPPKRRPFDGFNFSEWYDASINWDGRLQREIPILTDVLGPPRKGGLVDAGCGSGRHVCALAELGYRVVGIDLSEEMLEVARRRAQEASADVTFVLSDYATMHERIGGGFDGLFCLANSLPAAGTAEGVSKALDQFARCLRTGGRFCLEVLNFTPMRADLPWNPDPPPDGAQESKGSAPNARGISGAQGNSKGGVQHVAGDDPSEPGFQLDPQKVCVSKITIGDGSDAKQRSTQRRLYPVTIDEMHTWCEASGLRIDEKWGSPMREPFDVARSIDLFIIGTRL